MKLDRRSFLGLLGITPIVISIPLELNTKPIKTLYKIVNSDYKSPMVSLWSRSGRVRNSIVLSYDFKKLIKPDLGKIFVFASLEEAINNKSSYYYHDSCKIIKGYSRNYEETISLLDYNINVWNSPDTYQNYACNGYKCIICDDFYVEREIECTYQDAIF